MRLKDRRVLAELQEFAKSRRSDCTTHNHAAAVFRNGKIIAMARNLSAMPKTDRTDRKRWVRHAHAEIRVIKLVEGNADQLSILVVRVNARGELVMSKPCPICQAAIKNVGFRRVMWSDAKGQIVSG